MTDKQKIFCEKYIQCWNATEAARQAGYKGNDVTLAAVGYENLRKPQIAEYIDERVEEVSMSTNEILHRLAEWGRGTVEPFLTSDDFSEALSVNSEDAKKAIGLIKKIKQHEQEVVSKSNKETIHINRRFEIELHDAKDAVIQLAKIKGLFTEYIDISSQGEKIQGCPIVLDPQGKMPDEK